ASIAEGCRLAGCALIGGETAEMPGMYAAGDYDLAGFCVGAVDRDKAITGENIRPGDLILGLASSGVHSNGFSLVRKVVEQQHWDLEASFPNLDQSLGAALLEPTKIYVRSLLPLIRERKIAGLAHITGGGLLENIPRVLPERCHAIIATDEWKLPPIFSLPKRVAILISGRGSNMRALVEQATDYKVALVASNRPNSEGLEWARGQGLATWALDSKGVEKEQFDRNLSGALDSSQVGTIALAG